MISQETIDAMLAAGATVDVIAAAWKAELVGEERRVAAKREKDRDRQRRHRMSRNVTVTPRDERDPPNDIYSNPPEEVTTGAKAPSVKSAPKVVFACPAGVDPSHWRDFLENRKRKHLAKTQTAYEAILDDLAKFADDEWPPGRLVQHAAGKGWGSINDPRKPLEPRNGHERTNGLGRYQPNDGLSSTARAAVAVFGPP